MGWKNVKEHYRIKHHVHVTPEGMCIGSAYAPNLIVLGWDGVIKKRYEREEFFLGVNEDLQRYQSEIDADPDTFQRLAQSPDTFSTSIPVYTFIDGEILEKQCEEPGWPNVTHDGCLMFQNTYSTDKAVVVAWAKRDIAIGIQWAREDIVQTQTRIEERRAQLRAYEAKQAKLEAAYPSEQQT